MGAADMAYVLWTRFLRFDPRAPDWRDRDRFVLSAGHGSALLYSLLHLSGYDLPMQELRDFRQLGSKTAGHPEYGHCPGIEVTTGPLGQGIAHAVGMALAARLTASQLGGGAADGPGTHTIYGIAGDGDMMEGVSAEACSLAGHLGLGNLVFLYDDNHITIDGPTSITFAEDVLQFSSPPQYLQNWASSSCPSRLQSGHTCVVGFLRETLTTSVAKIPVGMTIKL